MRWAVDNYNDTCHTCAKRLDLNSIWAATNISNFHEFVQISHVQSSSNFLSKIGDWKTSCFYPINFCESGMSAMYFFIFAGNLRCLFSIVLCEEEFISMWSVFIVKDDAPGLFWILLVVEYDMMDVYSTIPNGTGVLHNRPYITNQHRKYIFNRYSKAL